MTRLAVAVDSWGRLAQQDEMERRELAVLEQEVAPGIEEGGAPSHTPTTGQACYSALLSTVDVWDVACLDLSLSANASYVFGVQDMVIASLVVDQMKSCIFVANKSDLCTPCEHQHRPRSPLVSLDPIL
eukprot:6200933-Pleurochrysis_carterae.AAC.2